MKPTKFLWWGDDIYEFDQMCEERDWVEREELEDFLIEELPSNPKKIRMEVPTDYWSDIENPDLNTAGEFDLLELDGIAYYQDEKIDFRMTAKMERDPEDPEVGWKVWKMHRKNV
ncbi:MAG: hypothetical protein SV760_04875 [Halobacteria archaeon]|nr:hypothetical protein [Halobacteria archaeon]